MGNYEVPEPILNSPFEEPKVHWHIVEGESRNIAKGDGPRCITTANPSRSRRHQAGKLALGGALAAACQQAGFGVPVICTPRELMVKPSK